MADVGADGRTNRAAKERSGEVPETLERALAPEWLSFALGHEVTSVETVEVLKTVATKARFTATFAEGGTGAFCLKGLLDTDETGPGEFEFYITRA